MLSNYLKIAWRTIHRHKVYAAINLLGLALGMTCCLFILLALAFLIAGPLAWFAMNAWLHAFAYRINISWWIFALAGSVALLIAVLTVSYQAIRAATANPVSSLRSE
jgi:putative ABC transport system permease protein